MIERSYSQRKPRLALAPFVPRTIQGSLLEKNQVIAARILLVEDEGVIRMVTADYLRDEGFEVVEARDGDEAARLLDTSDSFDVLVTDVRMPGTLDGVDVAVRARRRYPEIPVLVVSGYAARLTSRLGALQPPAVFIGKPYALREIVNALSRLTGNREALTTLDD